MTKTIHSVKRYIQDEEVTRDQLLTRKIKNEVLDNLYQTALKRLDGKMYPAEQDKKIS